MYIKSFSQLTNPGGRQEGQGYMGGKRIEQGEASFEASCQFQTDSCTFPLAAPRGSFSSPGDTFLLLLTQKSLPGHILLFLQPLANGKAKLADIIIGCERRVRMASVRGSGSTPRLARGLEKRWSL